MHEIVSLEYVTWFHMSKHLNLHKSEGALTLKEALIIQTYLQVTYAWLQQGSYIKKYRWKKVKTVCPSILLISTAWAQNKLLNNCSKYFSQVH